MTEQSCQGAMPEDWLEQLRPAGLSRAQIDQMLREAYRPSNNGLSYPGRSEVFNAFHLTPFDRVRVVIIGQDPYPNSEFVTGLAFSTPPEQESLPPALMKIFEKLESDDQLNFVRPASGNLTKWAEGGALLLNASLTFGHGTLDQRCAVWRPLLRAVLNAVSRDQKAVPIMLLGAKANELREAVKDQAALIAVGLPVPRSHNAKHFRLFKDANPFAEANQFCLEHGVDPFDWSLT